jgi:ribonuclease Y
VDTMQAGLVGFVVASVVWLLVLWTQRAGLARRAREADAAGEKKLEEALRKADSIERDAEVKGKEAVLQARAQVEQETREQRQKLQELEKKLTTTEVELEKRAARVDGRDRELGRKEKSVQAAESRLESSQIELDGQLDAARKALEAAAEMTREEAKRALVEEMSSEARLDAGRRIRQIEEEAKAEAERRAKKVVAVAIERLAGEWVAERTVSILHLPSDDMKGRLIGREGRNIRAIEAATGVDLIIDDTPETVVVSCHNPIRREIAKIAVEKLIADGRIHPGRIEELVRKAEKEVEETVREAGQKALFEVGVHGVHPELIKLLGMLRYRYSYGQNVLAHSIEAAFICGVMASELGLNAKQARRAALLHDIGKSLTHEVEGSHALIGADIARKHGESAKICNAIAAHHEEVKAETMLAPLVDAADALSGARPGARREVLESYVQRLEDLEKISNSFKGVEKSFAVQAGREIRIFVEPGKVSDDESTVLARDVARRIESEMTYPGQIRVTVIREMRASDVAR